MAHARSTPDDHPPLLARVRSLSGSPLIYVGAITVVVALAVLERLPLEDTLAALALLPITLALLYGQLALLVYYRRKTGRSGCS